MFVKLDIKLKTDASIVPQMASSFHGALMELISPEYADVLHQSRIHPYAQHIERRNGEWHWVVCALNEEAANELIENALLPAESIHLDKHDMDIALTDRHVARLTETELAEAFYRGEASRFINLRFITPAAFKLNSRYVNYPEMRSIYSNLMNRYDAVSSNVSMRDDETLEQLAAYTSFYRYELRSTAFSLEGTRIPAFTGNMTLKLHGTQTMCAFAGMLFRFGSYAGIGIKTSLGMGAIELISEGTLGV